MNKYYGKYRGKVTSSVDETGRGRIQVSVPEVFGRGQMAWAMPCVPYAGDGVGFFAIPERGANVWVEFEAGNINKPIWSGCFWDEYQVPAPAPYLSLVKVFKTDTATITIDDTQGAGGLTIETTAGMKLVMTATGIEITNGQGKIQMQGPLTNINNGGLEVQ